MPVFCKNLFDMKNGHCGATNGIIIEASWLQSQYIKKYAHIKPFSTRELNPVFLIYEAILHMLTHIISVYKFNNER